MADSGSGSAEQPVAQPNEAVTAMVVHPTAAVDGVVSLEAVVAQRVMHAKKVYGVDFAMESLASWNSWSP